MRDRVRCGKTNSTGCRQQKNNIVDFLPVDSSTAINLFEAGQADVIWDKSLVPTELLDALSTRSSFHKFITSAVTCGSTQPKNRLMIPACARRWRWQSTRREISRNTGRRALGLHFVHPAPVTTPRQRGSHDVRAKRCWPRPVTHGNGFPTDFEYLFNSSELNRNIAVELRGCGKRRLASRSSCDRRKTRSTSPQSALDYHVSRSSWIGDYNDPNTFLDMFMSQNGNNRTGWSNEQ